MKGDPEEGVPKRTAKRAGELTRASAADTEAATLVAGLDAVLWEGVARAEQRPKKESLPWRYTYVSPQAERILGHAPARWLADPRLWFRCVLPEDRERVLDSYQAAVSRAESFHVEYGVLRRGGATVFVRESVTVHRVGRGTQRRLCGVVIDVTDWKRTEQALRDAEERYRDLAENLNECVFSLDEDGRIVYMSPAIEQISDYTVAEVLNRHFSDFVHPDDLDLLSDSFAKALGGHAEPFEYRVLKKSGETRWVRSWSRLVRSGERIAGVRGALVDITDRREAEAALRESEARYQQLFENANDMLYTFDPDGRFTSVNSAVEQVTGYSRQELLGMNILQLTAPETRDFARSMIQRKLAGMHTTYEVPLVTKDGRRIPVEVSSRALMHEGRPVEIQGIARDLTERRRSDRLAAERNQLANEVRVASALARAGRELMSCRSASALLERLCRITTEVLQCDCSHIVCWQAEEDAYAPVCGYGHTPEEEEMMRVVRIPRSLWAPFLEHLAKEDVSQVLLYQPRDAPLMTFPMRFGATVALFMLLRRGDEILGIHAACYRGREEPFSAEQHEIARGVAHLASLALEKARLLGELERANRLKSDFMATMSHELRTPLHVILGYNQMLLDQELGQLNSEQAETSRRIKKSASDLLDLVNATLAVGRLETGGDPVSVTEIDLAVFLARLEAETRELRRKAGVEVLWRVASELPPIRTDVLKLKVVMKNLISNALKFAPQGVVCVEVHAGGDAAELVVSDTGIGIPEEQRQAIFEPFYQVAEASPRAAGGVGLGLYIVRRLLDLIGGSITVDSEPGRGSTFRVRLRAVPRANAATSPTDD